jgi:hypothetical protein
MLALVPSSSARGLAGVAYHEVEAIKAVEFCPSSDGSGPATEVHLLITVRGVPCPLILRLDKPAALDDLIGHLDGYRRLVWPR